MSSIIKVDTIQTAAGGTPTAYLWVLVVLVRLVKWFKEL